MSARKIAYNVAFSAISKVLSTALALVSIGIITRYLGTGGFGQYATAVAFFSLFSAVSDLGLYTVMAREISRSGADEKKIAGNVFTLRIVSSVCILAISPIILFFLPYTFEVKAAIFLSGIAFVFSSSYTVLNGIFQKNLAMDRVAAVELAGKVIQLGVIAAAAWRDWGFLAIISSLVAYMFFNFVIIFFLSKRFVPFHLSFDTVFWKKFLKESLPMGGAVVITFLYFKFDTILLSLLIGSEAVGVYNGAYKILENLVFFPAMVIGMVLPILSKNIFTDRARFELFANKTFKVFIILLVPLVIGGYLLAENIVTIVGGKEFIASAPVLKVLIFSLGFIFLGHLFHAVLIVANQQKKLMYALGVCAAGNIGLNLLFIPKFSYIGAAATSVATEFFVVTLTMVLSWRLVRYLPKAESIGKIAISGICMASFILFFDSRLSFAPLFLGSAALYGVLILLFGAISRKEVVSIFRPNNQNASRDMIEI